MKSNERGRLGTRAGLTHFLEEVEKLENFLECQVIRSVWEQKEWHSSMGIKAKRLHAVCPSQAAGEERDSCAHVRSISPLKLLQLPLC